MVEQLFILLMSVGDPVSQSAADAYVTPNEAEIYLEALSVLRTGRIDGVALNSPVVVARWARADRGVLVSREEVPELYRGAFDEFEAQCGSDSRLDLSTVEFEDVTVIEPGHFEPGACKVSFSVIGFDAQMRYAVVRVRANCYGRRYYGYNALIFLWRLETGWHAKDFVRFDHNLLKFDLRAPN